MATFYTVFFFVVCRLEALRLFDLFTEVEISKQVGESMFGVKVTLDSISDVVKLVSYRTEVTGVRVDSPRNVDVLLGDFCEGFRGGDGAHILDVLLEEQHVYFLEDGTKKENEDEVMYFVPVEE